MMAQGYEALCNVWVGFDDGRADLARKVLEVVEAMRDGWSKREVNHLDIHGNCDAANELAASIRAANQIAVVLRELFAKEGIDVGKGNLLVRTGLDFWG